MKKTFIITALFFMALASLAQTHRDTLVVDRAGHGDFRNIQDAIEQVRAFDPDGNVVIYIRSGIYKEKLVLHTHINNVKLVGEDRDRTIITYDDHANIAAPAGSGLTNGKLGTFRTYTCLIRGNDITLENLTVENSALQLGQAVALHIEGDRVLVKNCKLLGNQDTVYTGRDNCRQLFVDCYIEGTTDFIFGPSTAWFERCEIFCKRNSFITAASTPQNIEFGYIFNNCKIAVNQNVDKMYLGRPWRAYAMTLFMNCTLPQGIIPAGWQNWNKPENEKTARYMEFNNSGDGAKTAERVTWAKILTKKEAEKYTLKNVMGDWKVEN